ncbi:hypothetical protein A0256_12680 [Mucilaginibacter sp. PAMC 26640]|nr:hypothetical protein A0256_12680 [Mucilaginibacter sp. PAMC 26640]
MKHLPPGKRLCLFIAFLLITCICKAQTAGANWTEKTARVWYKEKVWANRLTLNVHEPFNVVEFARQYQTNKVTWDKVVDFLRDRNLELMAPGKYPIDGDQAYATISEGEPKPLDTAAFESHKRFIDLHYVIRGRERIYERGKTDTVIVTKPYDPTKDVENYYTIGHYALAKPTEFFLFFPGEIHQANIGVNKTDRVKKMVIKIAFIN